MYFLFRALVRKSQLDNEFITFFSLMEAHIYSNKSFIHFYFMHLLPLDDHQFPRIPNISRQRSKIVERDSRSKRF